ncbi:MAG: hypothetical protein AAF989_14190 [Planctomycetota bacterium]
MHQKLQSDVHLDRPSFAQKLQEGLLDNTDALLTLAETDFLNIFPPEVTDADVVTLSPDRHVLRVVLCVNNGVELIRVPVATDNNLENQ